jgi:hypothetical protein
MTTLLDNLASRLDAELRRDHNYYSDCPFCGKEAKRGQKHFSFCDKGYKCWICEAKGKLPTLALHLGVTGGMPLRTHHVPQGERKPPRRWQSAPLRYLDDFCASLDRIQSWQGYKPLSLDTIARFRLGVGQLPSSRCNVRRLIVPVFHGGEIVAFHGRAFVPGDEDAKWLTAGGSRKDVLFNGDLLHPGATVVICENLVDCLLAMQVEPSIVAVAGGGSSWNTVWTQQLAVSHPRRVITWLDHDLAGNGSRYHEHEMLAKWKQEHPKATTAPSPRGPQICNELLSAGVPATLYEWPKGTPHKYDIGRALMEYQLRRAM